MNSLDMTQKTLSLTHHPVVGSKIAETPPSRINSWIRGSLLTLLSQAKKDGLILREHGRQIGHFGDLSIQEPAEIDVHDTRVYQRALLGGDPAAGEAYVDGWWSSPDLSRVTRFFCANLDMMDAWRDRFGWLFKPLAWQRQLTRLNSKRQAKRNILAHYDLGNDLYEAFLDARMQYSSGIFRDAEDSLSKAQENKLRRICDQLQLSPADHLLEIGTGWGGLAIFAASEYGCRVTSTTISDAQYQYACRKVQEAGLSDRVTLLSQDYRALTGQYDKVVSVEMIEAVGRKYLPHYFRVLNDRLKAGGMLLLQAITIADQRYDTYARGEDFIQKHIFPGGFLPSLTVLQEHLTRYTDMVTRDIHDIGIDYALTLRHWRNNVYACADRLKSLGYDERFLRLWEYYLAYCEGGFLERRISTVQLLSTKAHSAR